MEGNFQKGFEKGDLKRVQGEKWDFDAWTCGEIEKNWEKWKNIEE